ncbi:MAG: PLP-dependent aminotransferase family protein [Eubacteriales bacterium]|nr:PLP-dependent aminotransferase family protein [Eubacteriales bacterium]MDY3332553.1 PLP-dependent aminotransferase family protein [Gallibacter sp.]
MKYVIEKNKDMPAYLQLYYQLRRDIESGAYFNGQKLISKRVLAEELSVSVVTVEHAYLLLSDEGYIESRERSGYFVIYRADDFISHLNKLEISDYAQKIKLVNVDSNQNFPFSVLSRTIRKVLLDYGEAIFTKTDNKGCLPLREAISKYLDRAVGIKVSANQIVVGAGAEYLYGLVAQLLGKDLIYALENPSYSQIQKVYEANGVSCRLLEMGKTGIKTDELRKTDAQVLHVTPFNSSPSLVTADISKRNEYLKWIDERNGFLVEDNYDSELTVSKKNEDTIFSMSKSANVIYLNTFSHTVSSSLRIGYMVLSEELMKVFEEKLGFYSCTVSVFEQYVLTELINSGDFERQINRIRRQRRKQLKED